MHTKIWGQDYKKDSLQIKAYTEIIYKQDTVKSITLKKIFCSYCSELQKKEIGIEAMRLAEIEKEAAKNKLKNGIKRLAIYIRISKQDFAEIK